MVPKVSALLKLGVFFMWIKDDTHGLLILFKNGVRIFVLTSPTLVLPLGRHDIIVFIHFT